MKCEGYLDIDEMIALGGIDHIAELTGAIMNHHGIARPLFSKREIEQIRWRERIRTQGLHLSYDHEKSVAANLQELFEQAEEIQNAFAGREIIGALLQHLIGAKLEIDLGPGAVQHHRFSKTDHPYKRSATFEVGNVAIHVTSRPSEALVGKTVENIAANLRPMIVSVFSGVQYADFLLTSTELRNRIDVIDAMQFLTASIYQQSHFRAGACHAVLTRILERYNAIVRDLEDDPLLIVHF